MLGELEARDRLRPIGGREMKAEPAPEKREVAMLYTVAVVLLVLWLLGIVGTYAIGAYVHVFLVIALVLFVVQLLSGRKSLA